ncbi:hypothetical protein RQP46_005967 [Phenoliferia psychrophenolica]
MSSFMDKLRVQQPESKLYQNDQYLNFDLIPMSSARRTWTPSAYVTYWATGGFAIYIYATSASLISYGLSGPQAITASLFSPIVLSIMCLLCGWVGSSHHISFTVASRASWGMKGTYFAVAVRVIPALIWDGIESLYGAEAVSTLIGTMSISWRDWDYPLANGTLQLTDLIGLFIYYLIFLIAMWFPPERLQKSFFVSCVGFVMVVAGLLIWSVSAAGGAGPYFNASYEAPKLSGNPGWAWMFGATASLGSAGVVVLGQADWNRFSAGGATGPAVAQLWACPLSIFLASVCSIIITSASSEVLGEAQWQPQLLLRAIQKHYDDSPRARAAVFFASLSIVFSQVCVNIILNSVSAAMDLMAFAPKWLNIRRGAYLVALIGICVNPWQLTVNAQTFLTVLSGFGIFYGPMAGILTADFWICRRRVLKLEDLYLGSKDSIYWYSGGWNLRAVFTFVVAFAPSFAGYVQECSNLVAPLTPEVKIAHLGFPLGFCIAIIVYPVLNFFWPMQGLGLGTTSHDENTLILPQGYDQTVPTQGRLSRTSDSDSGSDIEKKDDGSATVVPV